MRVHRAHPFQAKVGWRLSHVFVMHYMTNDVLHDVVMFVMRHIVVMNVTIVMLFGEDWTH
jgi:hypothetical protein